MDKDVKSSIELLNYLITDDNWKFTFKNEKKYIKFVHNTAWDIVNRTRDDEENYYGWCSGQ